MGATIRDIAKQVGLSVTTVSRALNDHGDVAPATKARVRTVATRLNYHPNVAARALKMDRANALGLVVPLGLHRSYDPFWLDFIGGMAASCTHHGVDLLLSATDGSEDARTSFLRLVQGRRVDGLVVCDIRTDDSRIRWLQEWEIPFVAFGRTVGEAHYWYVDVDGAAGVLKAMLYLIHLGHRRIAYLGLDPTFGFSHFRLAGYREALQRNAIPYDSDLVSEGLTEETAQAAAEAMLSLDDLPTALLASSDFLALATLRAARSVGLSVPGDLSVISFDDNLAVQRLDPPLTAVGQPNRRLGEEAGELLLDQLRLPERGPSHRLIVPSLVIRSSTGPWTDGAKGDATRETVA